MFWKSLQWRLVFIFISITLVLIFSISAVLNVLVQSKFYDVFKESIDKGFIELNNRLKDEGNEKPTISELEYILGDENGGRNGASLFFSIGYYKSYLIINKRTQKIIRSSNDDFEKNRFNNDILLSKNLMDVFSGKEVGASNTTVTIGDKTYFDYAKYFPLKDDDYILYFMNDKRQWKNIILEINRIIMFAAFVAIGISVVLGYIFARTITVPITNVMLKAQLIASGEFDQLLEVKSDDEIGKLTETFNIMAKELKKTLSEISSEKNKIETILNYMTDGVIAFNDKGIVIHTNPAAKIMVGPKFLYSSFDEFSQKYGLNITLEDIIKQVLFQDMSEGKENYIELDRDKIYRVYYAPIANKRKELEGLVVVLQDVTEQQKLENMRKEFVANVSHELKTPLTSIKSYAETLIEGIDDIETEKRFLGVIDSEADRMTRLVRDLLQLSSFDNERVTWNMKEVSFQDIVKRSVEKMDIKTKGKKQKVICELDEDLQDMYMDEDRIEQVVLNILSNSIKYTPNNGEIKISLVKDNKNAILIFKDTGIGIPKKDLSRIFERFYRVDKARSREMGGTGLGLSIAKQIIEYHDGNIKVESNTGKGTKVIISLPI